MNYMMALEIGLGVFMGTMAHDFAWILIGKMKKKK